MYKYSLDGLLERACISKSSQGKRYFGNFFYTIFSKYFATFRDTPDLTMSVSPTVHMSIHSIICLSIYTSIWLSLYPSTCLFVHLFIRPSVHPIFSLFTFLFECWFHYLFPGLVSQLSFLPLFIYSSCAADRKKYKPELFDKHIYMSTSKIVLID